MRVFASNVVRTIYSDVFAALNIVVLQGLDGGIQFQLSFTINYRKIPKISLEAYIFERPFLRGLFLEGLIFGGAYLRREICVSKSIGLAL